jgi:hypothetical protein
MVWEGVFWTLKPLDIVQVCCFGNLADTGWRRSFVRSWRRGKWNQTFVDGIRVAQPYGATSNNTYAVGFLHFFFVGGILFLQENYSAEYGEALSSVLLLNTEDNPDQNKTEVS